MSLADATSPAAPARSGRGDVGTAFVDGASALIRLATKSPLKLVVSRERGPCVRVHAATFGGGLLAGDAVSVDVDVGAGSSLAFGTSAPGKVYRSDDGRTSTQDLRVRVGADGVCLVVPAPLTCFEKARYEGRTELDLDAGASALVQETLTSGRSARGERWAFDHFASRTRLRIEGRLVLHEAVRLEAGAVPIADRFGAIEATSVVVLAGPRFALEIERIRESIRGRPARRDEAVRIAASPQPWGLVVRAAATAVEPLELALRELFAPTLAAIVGADSWHGPW